MTHGCDTVTIETYHIIEIVNKNVRTPGKSDAE